MKSDQGYKGKIVFYRRIDTGYISCATDDGFYIETVRKSNDLVYLAETEVDVSFQDARQEEISCLEKQLEKESAKFEATKNMLLGRIQELQALEHIE